MVGFIRSLGHDFLNVIHFGWRFFCRKFEWKIWLAGMQNYEEAVSHRQPTAPPGPGDAAGPGTREVLAKEQSSWPLH